MKKSLHSFSDYFGEPRDDHSSEYLKYTIYNVLFHLIEQQIGAQGVLLCQTPTNGRSLLN